MTKAAFSPAARRDLLDAIRWIAKENPRAALALRETITEAAGLLGEHPHLGKAIVELAAHPVRFLPLTGFPYVVVYDCDTRPPLILRLLHGARDLPKILADL